MLGCIAEYEQFGAIGLATLIARREVTALEVLDDAITRAEKLNLAINAIVMELYDQARAFPTTPLPEGPFAGVPFLRKDLCVSMAGMPTTGSSKLFTGLIADHDSTLVARYRAAELNIFGRTATAELSALGRKRRFGRTPRRLRLRVKLSLSRLNHMLPRGKTQPKVMQTTAEFHYQVADATLP